MLHNRNFRNCTKKLAISRLAKMVNVTDVDQVNYQINPCLARDQVSR